MLRIRVKTETPSIDIESYTKAMEKVARDAMAFAAVEFILASIRVIPVWSGASQATFSKLADLVGMPYNPPGPTGRAPDRRSRGASQGDAEFDGTSPVFKFSYSTDLPWLVNNELGVPTSIPLITPIPYNFREIASRVAEKALQDLFDPPKLDPHIKIAKKTLRVL